MPELNDLLERRAAGYEPPNDLLARVREQGRRRQRTRRVATAAVALLVTVVAFGGLFRVLTRPTVLFGQPADPWVGTWVSIDLDGSSQTMDISAVDGIGYEVIVRDDGASVCAGAPSTMTGTGHLDDSRLVLPAPVLECADGSTPVPMDGSSLEEAVRDYTLSHDAATETLRDNIGVTWRRPRAAPGPGPTEAGQPVGMWPQSNLDEVREAQEGADAGDPKFTWQVDPALDDGLSPGDAEIFSRFLTEELGWAEFRWGTGPLDSESGVDRSDSAFSHDVLFVRCAAGQTNSLYPNDPKGRRCKPTLDEFTYETVKVGVYQPLGTGPDGIWAVRSWQPQPSIRQTVPPSDAEVAELLEAFLQARVDRQGAQAYLQSVEAIPLLYTTSSGARYERFDFDSQTVWPTGVVDVNVRLFAERGNTVVEQDFNLERGRRTLGYDRDGTTENGSPVADPPQTYSAVGGQVTFSSAPFWDEYPFSLGGEDMIALIQDKLDHLFVVVEGPRPPTGSCSAGNDPASVDELVRSIRSSRKLSARAPVAARLGTIDAVQLDVTSGGDAATCADGVPVLAPRPIPGEAPAPLGVESNDQMRLYLFDVPGTPVHTVAVLIRAPKPAFERALDAVQPIIDSFELDSR